MRREPFRLYLNGVNVVNIYTSGIFALYLTSGALDQQAQTQHKINSEFLSIAVSPHLSTFIPLVCVHKCRSHLASWRPQ